MKKSIVFCILCIFLFSVEAVIANTFSNQGSVAMAQLSAPMIEASSSPQVFSSSHWWNSIQTRHMPDTTAMFILGSLLTAIAVVSRKMLEK